MKAVAKVPSQTYRSKAEETFAWELEARKRGDQIRDWKYEPVTFKLGGDTRYTPDFMVVHNNGVIEFMEVKGHMRDAARVKIRVAATMFPIFEFTIQWFSNRGFQEERVKV